MTNPSLVETEYSPDGRPEYNQLFIDEESEALSNLNQIYVDEKYSLFEIKIAARKIPDAERIDHTIWGGLPSKDDYPTTEDGYMWNHEILRSGSGWRDSIPFIQNKEIAVLFPQRRSGIDLEFFEENPEIYLGDHLNDEEIRDISDAEENESLIEVIKRLDEASVRNYVENNSRIQRDRLDRSIAVYATDNVGNQEAEEFLWEISSSLQSENQVRKRG